MYAQINNERMAGEQIKKNTNTATLTPVVTTINGMKIKTSKTIKIVKTMI